MQNKLKSLLFVFGLMLVLPLSIAAVGTVNLDVDSQYISCDGPLTDSPSGAKGDMIAISTSDGEGCAIHNWTSNTYDIAVQYRVGPDYRLAYAEKYFVGNDKYSVSDVKPTGIQSVLINQYSASDRLITTNSVVFSPSYTLEISNGGRGMSNVEGFIVRKREPTCTTTTTTVSPCD